MYKKGSEAILKPEEVKEENMTLIFCTTRLYIRHKNTLKCCFFK